MAKALSALRDGRAEINAALSSFIREPLVEWRADAERLKKRCGNGKTAQITQTRVYAITDAAFAHPASANAPPGREEGQEDGTGKSSVDKSNIAIKERMKLRLEIPARKLVRRWRRTCPTVRIPVSPAAGFLPPLLTTRLLGPGHVPSNPASPPGARAAAPGPGSLVRRVTSFLHATFCCGRREPADVRQSAPSEIAGCSPFAGTISTCWR